MAAPPHLWPIEQRITRYALRPLTTEERAVFPGIPLACAVFKGRLLRPPSAIPGVRAGWVVWIAETYPGNYLVRLPGGANFLVPYLAATWERVHHETPATTIEEIRRDDKRRQAEALKWRPSQMITTPETCLNWSSLSEWLIAWHKLQNRAHSTLRYQQEAEHIRVLPVEMIEAEADTAVLYGFLDALNQDDAIPSRGMRQKHPTTPLVIPANNRLAELGADSYRLHRQQQSMRRMLQPASRTRLTPSVRPDGTMTLSLF